MPTDISDSMLRYAAAILSGLSDAYLGQNEATARFAQDLMVRASKHLAPEERDPEDVGVPARALAQRVWATTPPRPPST